MNMNNDGDVTMMESALQNAPEEFCKRMEEVRNDSLDTRCTFQNTMLNVVMVFLGLSIPMFCAFSFNKFINACMGIGIVSGMIAAGMLIITQYKLLRQKEETVNKMLLALFRQKATGLLAARLKV